MPLSRRVPKRGFTNIFKTVYNEINLDRLERVKKDKILPKDLVDAGLLKNDSQLIKILGRGEIKAAKEIHAHKFTASAQEKIQKAGGKAILIGDK
jgi:large subunit ribosomal protein L15